MEAPLVTGADPVPRLRLRRVPRWRGVVDAEGTLHLEAAELYQTFLRRLKHQRVVATVEREERPKSRSQLGYWHGVVIPLLAEEFGYRQWEHDAVHDAVLRVLRGVKPAPNPLGVRVSMADMPHDDVTALIDDCRHWALTEHGIAIPDARRG